MALDVFFLSTKENTIRKRGLTSYDDSRGDQ